jgi:hypothetical protein
LFLQEPPYKAYLLHAFPSQWVDKEETRDHADRVFSSIQILVQTSALCH